jgi:hypothetical protein
MLYMVIALGIFGLAIGIAYFSESNSRKASN